MYKLVAIDLDGTMLNSYGEVTENTKKVIREQKEKGIEIVIASGRTIDSIKNIAEEIGGIRYIISGNGAIVYDIEKEKIIYEKCISKIKALNLIKICEENSITYSVYTDKAIVANALKYNVLYYHKENLKKEESKKTSIKIVENIYEYIRDMQDEQVMKISICDEDKTVFKAVLNKLREFNDVEILDVAHMSRKIIKNGTEEVPIEYYYTEISEKNVDKWKAIEFLMKLLNINKEEIIAIGDNINDKEMIQNAGMGVAMKGSTPQITEIADYITEEDNNHEGVVCVLEKFIQ